MSELVINGVNMLDPGMIGLKCIFSDGIHDQEGILTEVLTDGSTNPFMSERGYFYEYCRLAQGDKTPHDGSGQPVPDGVVVKVWLNGDTDYADEGVSQGSYWGEGSTITDYQIQEQPVEQATESDKTINSTIQLGTGIIQNGKNIPLEDFYKEPKPTYEELQAQVNRLRKALVTILGWREAECRDGVVGYIEAIASDALNQTPHQSLPEHDAKEIENIIPELPSYTTLTFACDSYNAFRQGFDYCVSEIRKQLRDKEG